MLDHLAKVIYPGSIKGRPTIELKVKPDGTNEAYLVPDVGIPVPTGISLEEKNSKSRIYCRIRKKKLHSNQKKLSARKF